MTRSHAPTRKPSPLLALICLAILRRHRPEWAAVTTSEAAEALGIKPARLSRLSSRVIECIEPILAGLTRMGRPPSASHGDGGELALCGALLEAATSLLGQVPARGATWRALVTGAWLRLHDKYPTLTQKRFCEALAVPTRTLRHWLTTAPKGKPAAKPPPERKRKKRPARRGRFGFDVTMPDTQTAADTTNLEAFGVDLKLVAAQDVGGRDQDLFDAVIVDDHEDADLVTRVLREANGDRRGVQVITDQGTPYMARETEKALDELGAEHAPQREGDPTSKATIERAFRTIKDIAAPILNITNQMATTIPSLRQPELAKAAAKLLLTALLRAYQAGARASRRAGSSRLNHDTAAVRRIIEEQREKAHARDKSARMLLSFIHDAYVIGSPKAVFIRAFRGFPLPVLREAERLFAQQAHRDDIRVRSAYFARLVRICETDFNRQRARERGNREMHEELENERRRVELEKEQLSSRPDLVLHRALETVAAQWSPDRGAFLAGEIGPATPNLKAALEKLRDIHGDRGGADIADGVVRVFERRWHDRLGECGAKAVVEVYRAAAGAVFTVQTRLATIKGIGLNLRPAPPI